MTEIRYYHLQRTTLEAALPAMLMKTLERGQRAVVMAGSPERVEALTQHLWTYDDRAFLPHGSAADGHAQRQPIWLTAADENPNGATTLFLTDGATSERVADYALCAILFDGNDPAAVAAARRQWELHKAAGHSLAYFQQTDKKGWERKSGAAATGT
jgi:DNA polymerase-3 subunit chi